MTTVYRRGGWVIAMSFIVAMMLTMLPLPDWAEYFRPEWVTMVLIYWCMALPNRVGVGIGWLVGLFLDVIHGAVLGQYALALALIAFFTLSLHRRLRVYPLLQQSLVVLMLIVLQLLIITWVKGFLGLPPDSISHWLPSVSSMLLWAWVFIILRDLRRHFRVS